MATGAGKTFTAVTASYRLIKHAGAARILFLVDPQQSGRAGTGRVRQLCADRRRPQDLGEIYNVQRLAGHTVLGSTNVAISTIQRLYGLLQGKELPTPMSMTTRTAKRSNRSHRSMWSTT